MRILVLYPYLPSPRAGHGSARLVSRLLARLQREVEITLVCAYRPGEREDLEEVAALCAHLYPVERPFASDLGGGRRTTERARTGIRLLGTGLPTPVVKLRRTAIRRALGRALAERKPDLVHVELAPMAQYVELFADRPSVLVDHEAAGPPGEETRRWTAYVRETYARFARVVTLCEEDKAELLAIAPGLRIDVRPPGVEVAEALPRAPEPGRLLFFGSAEHRPNQDALAWLAAEILPRLRAAEPTARVVAAGGLPAAEIAGACRKAGIELLGFVDDLDREIARAAAVLAPIRSGRGVRMKSLEALAHGAPLVATPLGARGLALEPGVHAAIATGAEAFAAATVSVLRDPAAAAAMAARGRAHVLARHDPAAEAAATLSLWRTLA